MANERDGPGYGPAGGEMKQTIERATETARQSAQQLSESAQRQAKEITSDIQAQAASLLSEQKETVKSGMMDLVSAIRRAADDLEGHQQPQVASIARGLAGGIEDFSQSISRRNFQEMVSDVERFAREHPTAFVGGAVLAGLAIARFAKSSSRRHIPRQSGTMQATSYTGQSGRPGELPRQEREHAGIGGAPSTR